jgi:hypothetical protein
MISTHVGRKTKPEEEEEEEEEVTKAFLTCGLFYCNQHDDRKSDTPNVEHHPTSHQLCPCRCYLHSLQVSFVNFIVQTSFTIITDAHNIFTVLAPEFFNFKFFKHRRD